jgi:hypothetical protein
MVLGRIEAILPPQREGAPDVMIVVDNSNPKYPNRVACEFMSKHASKLDGLAPDDYVKVIGSIRSKEWQGKWYTNFVAYSVMRLELDEPRPAAPLPPARAPSGSGRPQHREVRPGDDDIPF